MQTQRSSSDCIVVEKYSGRLFTNEEDYFSGFAGFLQNFRKLYDEHFVWGLPESLFSSAARWKQLPSSLSATSTVLGAVVVGDTDTWGRRKHYFNVMLVSWVEGIAYREGMLSMLESDWLRLDRTWKQITVLKSSRESCRYRPFNYFGILMIYWWISPSTHQSQVEG